MAIKRESNKAPSAGKPKQADAKTRKPSSSKGIRSPTAEQLEDAIPGQATGAFRAAFEATLRAGVPAVVAKNGKVVRIDPDGKETVLKDLPPRQSVKPR